MHRYKPLLAMSCLLVSLLALPGAPLAASAAADREYKRLQAMEAALQELLKPGSGTDDALWDQYCSDMLLAFQGGFMHDFMLNEAKPEALAKSDEGLLPYIKAAAEDPPRVPDSVLAALEPKFGGDPRYWQLRYWNAWQTNSAGKQGDPDPLHFLRDGRARGATDAAAAWLLLQADLRDVSPTDKQLLSPTTPGTAPADGLAAAQALEREYQRELKLLGAFIDAYPQESIGWYTRAVKRMEYGEIDECLADLRSGNAAAHNRVPLPFPLSYVNQRTAASQPVGSEVVAGVVASAEPSRAAIPDLPRIKEMAKTLVASLSIGGSLDDFQPMFDFACRQCQMQDASRVERYVGGDVGQMLVDFLLESPPEGISREQREALVTLKNRLSVAKRRMRDDLLQALSPPVGGEVAAQLGAAMWRELAAQGVTAEDLALFAGQPEALQSLTASLDDPGPRDLSRLGLWQWGLLSRTILVRELGALDRYAAIYEWKQQQDGLEGSDEVKRFDRLQRFDFATLAWPEDDAGH